MGKGKRKKAVFGWVRDADEPVPDRVHRPTRAERTADGNRAKRVAKALVALDAAARAQVPLDPSVVEALETLEGIKRGAHGARARALKRLAAVLRLDDLDAIEAALAELAPPPDAQG